MFTCPEWSLRCPEHREADADGQLTAVDTTNAYNIAYDEERAITDRRLALAAETQTCGYAAAGADTQ